MILDELRWALIDALRAINEEPQTMAQHARLEAIALKLGVDIQATRGEAVDSLAAMNGRQTLKLNRAERRARG